MYEEHHPIHVPQADPTLGEQAAPAVWVGEQTHNAEQAGRPADPYDVINFLLKKVEEQQSRLNEQDGYIELQNQETEQLKAQIEAARKELEAQLADYDVLMQNTLVVERELETYKQRATEKPTIQLPFHTEQKLAKLGYGDLALEERQAV